MMHRVPLTSWISLCALLVLTSGASAQSGMVTYLGQENDASSFRTTTVAKSFDPNGNNVYGEDGYVLYTTERPPYTASPVFTQTDPLTYNDGTYQTLSLIPSYLSLANNGQSWAVGGFGYPLVDAPTAMPGSSVPQLMSGLALNNFVTQGTEASVLDITVGAGAPASGLLLGVMLIGSGEDEMSSVRLTQTGGTGAGSATASVTTSPGLIFEFFTLTGESPGDTYTLYLTKTGGNNPNVDYVGLTFDTLRTAAVPEPGTYVMLGSLGLTGAAFLSRRKYTR